MNTLDPHYQAIQDFYGTDKAERSGVPYINHIHQGLIVLDRIKAGNLAYHGYCLHPIFQSDSALSQFMAFEGGFRVVTQYNIPMRSIIAALEYRRAANSYLSHDKPEDYTPSPLKEVQEMLIADKVQNRKDFEIYHKATHPRSKELQEYFKNWMIILRISEEEYQDHVKAIS